MTTQASWGQFDRARLLSGNQLTGIGVETDRRIEGLLGEASRERSVRGSRDGIRRRVGRGLIVLGTTVAGLEVPQPIERPTSAC